MFEKCECGLYILIGVKKKKGGGDTNAIQNVLCACKGKGILAWLDLVLATLYI